MRLCDLDEIKIRVDRQYENCHGYTGSKKAIYREAILAVKSILHSAKSIDGVNEMEGNMENGLYTVHEVAVIIAELFGDDCACNFNDIDEWLPFKCELIDACPNTCGVACWEQYLKYRNCKDEMETNMENGLYTAHEVAVIIADLFGDNCACYFNDIDEWLLFKCDLIKSCPNPGGVACWEQYLKYRPCINEMEAKEE